MELFEEIRREFEFESGSVRAVAKKLGVHRRMVRQALADATPPERKVPERKSPQIEALAEFIDQILEADQKAPRKQRHTSHRIWTRIQDEKPGSEVGESTIRRYVGKRTHAIDKQLPHSMSWTLGCDHRNIDERRRSDLAKVDIESVSEHQGLTRTQVGFDGLSVDLVRTHCECFDVVAARAKQPGMFSVNYFFPRIDSRLLLPALTYCLTRMLPVLSEGNGQHNEEAPEHGNKARIDWICGDEVSRRDTK